MSASRRGQNDATEGKGSRVEKSERIVSQSRRNSLIISDIIRLQIRLRAIHERLKASPKRKGGQGESSALSRKSPLTNRTCDFADDA
jgi:hypothetical protein